MHIVQLYHSRVPVRLYGGMERVIEALCRGFVELGHKVTLIAFDGDYKIPGVNFISMDSMGMNRAVEKFPQLIPTDADIVHFHVPIDLKGISIPHIVTMHGNLQAHEDPNALPKNTVFLTRDHAKRHGGSRFVFNGLIAEDIPFNSTSLSEREYYSFLGRASLKRKGLHLAKKIARRTGRKLYVGGGRGINWNGIKFLGHVDNDQKYELLKNSRGLLFPIQWEEPFGLVMIEAMFTGAPVFALSRGSVPEVLGASGGSELFRHSASMDELQKMVDRYPYSEIDPTAIREYAMQNFTHISMCEKYLSVYKDVIHDNPLKT